MNEIRRGYDHAVSTEVWRRNSKGFPQSGLKVGWGGSGLRYDYRVLFDTTTEVSITLFLLKSSWGLLVYSFLHVKFDDKMQRGPLLKFVYKIASVKLHRKRTSFRRPSHDQWWHRRRKSANNWHPADIFNLYMVMDHSAHTKLKALACHVSEVNSYRFTSQVWRNKWKAIESCWLPKQR